YMEKDQKKYAVEQRAWAQRTKSVKKALTAELLKDGLITNPDNFSLEVNNKVLKVNKKKQSEALRQKYLELLEGLNGNKGKGEGSYHYNFSDDEK
ncbi:MAG: hypothetical protein Q8K92_26250, partial [Leadbetterella sp.]|nr:hypothetical protein [Leadbetterella sp.]